MTDADQKIVIGEPVDEDTLRNGQTDPIDPPDVRDGRWGIIGDFYRYYRARRKTRKLADKGYVRWYIVDGGWPEPKFVKPELKGGGVPEYELDDSVYLFPKRAGLPDRRSGMWTFVHNRGSAEPRTLGDSTEEAIKADEISEYLTKRVTTNPPSFWDKVDLDPEQILMLAIAAVILIAVLRRFFA